jgi:DNA processing protein
MPPDLLFQIALTMVPHVGCVQARMLMQQLGTALAVFKAPRHALEKIEGIGAVRAKAIKSFHDFPKAEKELTFLDKYGIRSLCFTDAAYPQRLQHCFDAPLLLFFKGEAGLNHPRILSVIGTRNHSDYGKQLTEKLVSELAELNVMIVSGLAYGIDALSHKAALKNKLPTIGVLGHGLTKIYPPEHAQLAREMVKQGGLLTEFGSNAKPDKHHFPVRNRIVAGMSDATVVIETGIKGGSMITADLANGYHKDVFAFPGKVNEPKSAGCNALIKNNRAVLLTDARQLANAMGWNDHRATGLLKTRQRALFTELTGNERCILQLLQEKQNMHIDELNLRSNISSSATAAAILNLEMQGIINMLPGKIYSLNNA